MERHDGGEAARTAVEWADAERWNPGLDDAQRFAAADPGAFLTARDSEIVGTISCALYGDAYAFLGFYIVRPDLRGRGIGSALFERALARAEGRVVGLDGVLAQQAYYERRGFELAHRNVRWRTVGGGQRPGGLADLASIPFEQLLAFDAAVFGAERARFLRVWVDRPAGHALAYTIDGELAGYGVLRRCHIGAKVGPLMADDEQVAETILRGLLAAAGARTEVFVDMPAANPCARFLRDGREMTASFETVRMYLNGRPPEDVSRVYGITSFEFG